jgi:hypothetical protein
MGILEASTPTLLKRYQQTIEYKANGYNFSISMTYPELISGPQRPVVKETSKPRLPADAGIHQLGQVKRRIIKKDFITSIQNQVKEFYKNR